MGARMAVTVQTANRLKVPIAKGRRSPYDAREIIVREFPGNRPNVP
ncbi:MAG: hypothetical protein IIT98_01210 [Kiritimatiellae bacterium]|nr:hypothetical protein [Kiritimatiellia bacterium]